MIAESLIFVILFLIYRSDENNYTMFQVKEVHKDPVKNEICLEVSVKNNSNVVKRYFLKGFW